MDRPIRVGITHGDINGIGYEIIVKAVGEEGITELYTPVIFGVPDIFRKAAEMFGYSGLKFNVAKDLSAIKEGVVNIYPVVGETLEVKPGTINKESGEAAVASLEAAVRALKEEAVDVLVTAPISKEAVQGENFNFPGHTEFLAERLGEGSEAMMILCNDTLRVALLTKHLPIAKIPENISEDKIISAVETFSHVLKKDFGIVKPSIAVLSLNPHAGDGGLLGNEEEEILKPALKKLQQNGYHAFGPFAADGFFGHGAYKNYDGILAMYHDQGLAPFKTIATSGGVNFTAALPFVRTSPDHGTAFDIAWKGEADATSMKDAIYMAIDIHRRRKTFEEASQNPLKKYVHERPERHDRGDRFPNKTELAEDSND